jgi:diguanylate cyclase (GGDEF)-like protein/PAS domain S-box-containing protein
MSKSEPARPSTDSGQSSEGRILYMEDDPGLARLFQKRLERAGYIVDIAHDGEEGLAMYEAGSYDVVAVDQAMPIHTGLEVIRIMASRGPLPPTIVVTGTGSEQIAVEAMKLGARDYIVKDVDGGYLELLPTVIKQVLQQQRLIEERQQALEALRESEARYRGLFDGVPVGLYRSTPRGQLLDANPALVEMLGYLDRETLLEATTVDLYVDAEDRRRLLTLLERDRVVRGFEVRSRRRDGTVIWVRNTVRAVHNAAGQVLYYEGSLEDITERKRVEEELAYMATHDALTGLPNRTLFNDRLTLALTHAHRNQRKLTVMLLDLDRFKDVNDTLGHSVGDKLLKLVGECLTNLLRKSDTVARMGGDEFMLMLPGITQGEDAAKIAQKTLEAFRKPFVLNDHELHITTSIGIAMYPDDGEDADTLMRNADTAMYRAKDQGRDNYQRYTPAMSTKASE